MSAKTNVDITHQNKQKGKMSKYQYNGDRYAGGFHANFGGGRYPAEISNPSNTQKPKSPPTPVVPATPVIPATPAVPEMQPIGKRFYRPSGRDPLPRVPDRVVEVTETPAVQERTWPTTAEVFGILLAEDPKPEPVQERTWPTTEEVFGFLIEDPSSKPAGERTWPTTDEVFGASDDEIHARKIAEFAAKKKEFAARRDALTKRSHDLREEVRKIAEAEGSQ